MENNTNKEKRILTPSDNIPSSTFKGGGNDFIPIADNTSLDTKDSNFVFFFGKPQIGKSVILASMLYQMNARAGTIRPKVNSPNSKEAKVLLFDMLDNIKKGILPNRSEVDKVIELDLVFEPNNKSKKVKPINLTFLEMSGENLKEVRRGGTLIKSIDEFLNASIPLTFILVTDVENADDDDALMISFLQYLEEKSRKYKQVNAILIIAKWDKTGDTNAPHADYLNDFIRSHMPMTNNQVDNYELFKTYYTVGQFTIDEDGEEKLSQLNLTTAKILTEWLYESVAGISLNYEGTFWERLFGK